MFSIHDRPYTLCDRISRRELMRIGGLNLLGLSLPTLLAAQARGATAGGDPTFGRAKNVIYLWLQGGPPQHETFDPKPDAPARNPRAVQADLDQRAGHSVLRAAAAHRRASPTSWPSSARCRPTTTRTTPAATGCSPATNIRPGSAREIKPTDWPYFGSIVKMLKPSERLPALIDRSGCRTSCGSTTTCARPGRPPAFWARSGSPIASSATPSADDYQIEGLGLQPAISRRCGCEGRRVAVRAGRPASGRGRARPAPSAISTTFARRRSDCSPRARPARRSTCAASRTSVRERYGKNRWGQCVLLARRLIEAGVRLVHVNWPREPGDTAVDNPLWDTHAQNADRLQDVLCPMFDVGFSALIEDLDQRGLLDETLVVAIGEFGRTPKINKFGGRDHWGHVFSFALAGAGIAAGRCMAPATRPAATRRSNRVQPQRPDGDDLPPAGHRPRRHVPRSHRPPAAGQQGRAAVDAAGHRAGDDRARHARRRPRLGAALRRSPGARHRFRKRPPAGAARQRGTRQDLAGVRR